MTRRGRPRDAVIAWIPGTIGPFSRIYAAFINYMFDVSLFPYRSMMAVVGKLTPERLEQMKTYIKMILFSYFNLDVPTALKMLDDLSREINAQ